MIKLTKDSIEIKGVTRYGNVIIVSLHERILISRKNFNKLMVIGELEGFIINEPKYNMYLFKVLTF